MILNLVNLLWTFECILNMHYLMFVTCIPLGRFQTPCLISLESHVVISWYLSGPSLEQLSQGKQLSRCTSRQFSKKSLIICGRFGVCFTKLYQCLVTTLKWEVEYPKYKCICFLCICPSIEYFQKPNKYHRIIIIGTVLVV